MCTAALAAFVSIASAQDAAHPALENASFLTPQHLRRLQRDRERQTVRWLNFEARVESVPDSPQRGFELALYYAVTKDHERGRQAVEWALSHHCDLLQFPHVVDWAGDLMSDEERRRLAAACPAVDDAAVLTSLQNGGFRDALTLYTACEYLLKVRATEHVDPRLDTPQFFSQLPVEFLLSLKPEQIDHPDWMTHIAGLALVAVDPNLEGSQYLQAWAIEDRQMIREGPGVAYEFLWADPYLPGVGYQNLDPWIYDPKGQLFARSNWSADACWIGISARGVEEQNCPSGWRDKATQFGRMTLLPMTTRCEELPHIGPNDALVLWHLKPHESVSHREGKQERAAQADAAGLLRLPPDTEGRACAAR